MNCGICLETCPNNALTSTTEGISIKRQICQGCGSCAEECPSNAMELLGKIWTVDDLIHEVSKDRAYFEKSKGGITASGGDPAIQAEFVRDFFRGLQERDIHTALDTCGFCSQKNLEIILPYSDMLLFDIKEIDSEKHKKFTGSANKKILQNLIFVTENMKNKKHPKSLWIRTPIIPNTTGREENITDIGKFILSKLNIAVSRWELCSFNNLSKDKYIRLNQGWPFKDCDLLQKDFMENLAKVAKNSGVNSDIVHWSGSTK